MELPNSQYPANNYSNPDVVYKSLGSFWTSIFQEKGTLKGLSLAQAEEAIQRYIDLIEVVDSYSVKDVPVYHAQRWYPIIIYKSKLNQSPLIFNTDDTVFGAQPDTDPYYAGVTFQFGLPKTPVSDVYIYDIEDELVDATVLADKVLSPKVVWNNGIDFTIDDGQIFFNKNIFEEAGVARSGLVSEDGEAVTYTDVNGNTYEEEIIILWAYNAAINQETLYNTFGYIFGLHRNNDQFFKDILKAVFALYVDGATVANIKTVCSAFLNIPTVIEDNEVVEELLTTSDKSIVVTDKNTYEFDLFYNLLSHVTVGAVFHTGDILVDGVEYCDNITSPNWWNQKKFLEDPSDPNPYLALSKHLFLGNYQFQLFFKGDIDIVSIDYDDVLHFPVKGNEEDIKEFHKHVDTPAIRTALGLANPGDVGVVNPLDFLFRNFFKNNTILLKFRFLDNSTAAQFLNLMGEIKDVFPPHVYIVFSLYLTVNNESYSNLNDCVEIEFDSGTETLNADGSNATGRIEELAPYGYKDVENRLFSVARSPNPPLDNAVIYLNEDTSVIDDASSGTTGMVVNVASASPLKPIPTGSSTASYSNLSLLNFS